MHVSFKIQYRNNLIDKKDSYLISCPPSWDDCNYSYGHQLYPNEYAFKMLKAITVHQANSIVTTLHPYWTSALRCLSTMHRRKLV